MPTVDFYATSRDPANPDGWIFPDQILNAPDSLCTSKTILIGNLTRKLQVFFTINLPAAAILDHIWLDCKGYRDTTGNGNCEAELKFGAFDNFIDGGGSTDDTCAGSVWNGLNGGNGALLDGEGITVAALNAGNFQAYGVVMNGGFSTTTAYIDAVRIRVQYHLPAVSKGVMDGFIFVS